MKNKYHQILQDAGIRPSIQRIAIYGYLCEHPVHPDVETVYNDLFPIYPTLSKTTVYNTLKLFEEKNIVQSLKIDDDKLRFDAEIKEHFHFKCTACGQIFDIFLDSQTQGFSKNIKTLIPQEFSISKCQTNIWGMCSNCINK